MVVSFCKNSSDTNVLNKSIATISTKDCIIYGTNLKKNPRIKINYDASIIMCNYLYIPSFERYYFIKDWELLPNGSMVAECSCDLLTSAKLQILGCEATVTRSNIRNEYIKDSLVTLSGSHETQARTLADLRQFLNTENRYILITSNKGS